MAGREHSVDLEGELWGPMFEPLRMNPELFRQVHVDEELGTIVWPNGVDMDPDVLHGDFDPADATTTSNSHVSPAELDAPPDHPHVVRVMTGWEHPHNGRICEGYS